jgi:uncharacterized protein (TIGR03118 family)
MKRPKTTHIPHCNTALPTLVRCALLCLPLLIGGANPAPAATHVVQLVNYAFQPQYLTIDAGDTVLWTNTTLTGHNVVSSNNVWTAPPLFIRPGTFSFTFSQAGSYGYYCSPHHTFGMTGVITVQEPPPPAPTVNAYVDHWLVSDLPGTADFTDPNLLNPWGIAFSPTGPFWISDNHAGVSTLYNRSGTPQTLIVNIPPPPGGSGAGSPTGIIFNNTTGFNVAPNTPARFIFSTEDGTLIGWASGTNAVVTADNSAAGAIYKGLALGRNGSTNFLYATDFHNAKVDVFDETFSRATLSGSFLDPTLPAGFAPFGIENVNGQLWVTYAKQDAEGHDDVPGPGNGYVTVFDTAGNLVRRFASGDVLDSPWGIAQAPTAFGAFGGALLIANFGDGRINAFNPATGAWLGNLTNSTGAPFAIDGLWAIKFGNGANGGDAHSLYYTAGIAGSGNLEDHGVFGSLTPLFPAFLTASNQGPAAALSWAGGVGPFLVQKRPDVATGDWRDVCTTTNSTVSVAKDGANGFFRIISTATNVVLPFTVRLDGASEIPPISDTAGTAVGSISIAGSNLTYDVSFSGLSAPATASHIHVGANPTNTSSVLIPLNGASGPAGKLSGTVLLTADQLADIVSGHAYINIHTGNHPGGEIRGQIVPLHIPLAMNGAAEIPAPTVPTTATGSGFLTLIGNQLYYTIRYSGLVGGPATAAHIHGPAQPGSPAPVLVPLQPPTGTAGTISGTVSLSPVNLAYLLAGQTYINLHTVTNSSGEIRGQITPLQFSATLNGASEVPPTGAPGSGQAALTLVEGLLSYSVSFTNLLSAATLSHIHGPADRAHNASVLIPFPNVPAATWGSFSGTTNLTSQQVADLVTGLTYANIHTTNHPGGEIRGQIVPNN